jgi:hypothetical protein
MGWRPLLLNESANNLGQPFQFEVGECHFFREEVDLAPN